MQPAKEPTKTPRATRTARGRFLGEGPMQGWVRCFMGLLPPDHR